MESTVYYSPRYSFSFHQDMYPASIPHSQQSYLRSQRYSPPDQQNFYHTAYSQPAALQDDSPPSSASSNSGSVLGTHDDGPLQDHPHEYIPDYSNYQLAPTQPAHPYPTDGSSAIPRNGQVWAADAALKHDAYPSYPAMQLFEAHPAPYDDPQLYQHYRDEHYAPHALALGPYYDGQEPRMAADAPLGAYTTQGDLPPSVVAGFSNSPTLRGQDVHPDPLHSPPPAYISSPSTASLGYPSSPVDAAPPSAFVSLQDVSPSPAVSPDQACTRLPLGSPAAYSFPAHAPYGGGGGAYEYAADAAVSPVLTAPALQRRPPARGARPAKKARGASSDEEAWSASAGSSGESEREEDGEGDDEGDDDEYTPDEGRTLRRRGVRRAASRSFSPLDLSKPRLGAPVPVPNLTKKSRGRRVPTSAVVVSQNGVEKNVRGYKCKVPGCNKCFQRGEHLKRHIRSIHTNEKPHKCPYKNCSKDFSRHDNLRQHLRVHRNDSLDTDA